MPAGIAVIALLGSHVYQTSLFSNDALSWLLIWWTFYLILKNKINNWLWLTLLLTLAHYTKTNIFVIYPVLLWFFLQEYKKSKFKSLHKSLVILLVPLILASPWYIRNHLLYDSYLMLSGSEWHFVSGVQSSLIKLAHAPYSFLFKMYFEPPRYLLSPLNYLQYLIIFPSFLLGLWHSRKSLKSNYNMQILLLMLITMITAYLWLAFPTGFTEGRMLFPALPVIIYFICEPWFLLSREKELQLYIIFALICVLLLPSYIIGFYL